MENLTKEALQKIEHAVILHKYPILDGLNDAYKLALGDVDGLIRSRIQALDRGYKTSSSSLTGIIELTDLSTKINNLKK